MPSRLLAGLVSAAAVLVGAPAAHASAANRALLAPSSACPNQSDTSLSVEAQESAMLCMVNHARTASGLNPLARNAQLSDSADRKARDIATCGFSHTACGLPFTQRITDVGYAYRAVGENIAYGTGSSGSVRSMMTAWLNSAGHKANILSTSFREQGVGLVVAGNAQYWVNQFARPR